jgi:hypothetical protein
VKEDDDDEVLEVELDASEVSSTLPRKRKLSEDAATSSKKVRRNEEEDIIVL